MKGFVFILIYLFVLSGTYAQEALSPELQLLLKNKSVEDQAYLIDSAAVAIRNENFKESIKLFNYNLSFEKSKGLHKEYIKTTLSLSRSYRNIGTFDTAQLYIDSALIYANQHQLNNLYGRIYDYEGIIYIRNGDYERAVSSLYKSITYALQYKDSVLLYDAYNHLGSVHFYRMKYQEACNTYKRALSYQNSAIKKNGVLSLYDNIGLCFSNNNQYDSALFYQLKVIKNLDIADDSSLYAESCVNIASTYMLLKDFVSAKPYLEQAVSISTNLKNEYGQLVSNLTISRLYFQTNQVDKAIQHLEIAYQLAQKLNSLNQLKVVYSSFSEIYASKGDFKLAYHYQKLLGEIIVKLYEDENTEALNELSTKYETQQKQQQILLLTKDSELKQETIKLNRIIYSAVASVLGIICLFFIYLFRKKRKDNKILLEKNEAIASQKQHIEQQHEELELKNTEITDSINYAKRIQASVIPSDSLLKRILPNSFVYFMPKDIVSGDFYWLSEVNQKIYFAIADCTGHGVPGAMMSMLGSSLLDKIISNEQDQFPADILKEQHKEIDYTINENVEQRDSKDGMDIAFIMIDKPNKKVYFSGAGRPAYLIYNNELQILKGDKYSIGGIIDTETATFSQHEMDIEAGMQIYLFSDGVPDQFGGEQKKKLMTKNLQKLLLQISKKPITEQSSAFKLEFERWKENTEQTDDVCLAGIQFH